MAKDILYSIAELSTGQLIKVRDAKKGISYNCPICKNSFVLRKGQYRQPHFAHKTLSPNCNPETALHYGFKTLLHQKIQKHIEENSPLEIEWRCCVCEQIHTGNMLKKATWSEVEYDLGNCRPDIALFGKDGNIIIAIKIIVTHKPEESTLKFYRENGIYLIAFLLKSEKDINRLNEIPLKPDKVNACKIPKIREGI